MDVVEVSQVANRLALGEHELVSLIGGGGKTTLLFAIAAQLTGRRIITTTTKMGREQRGEAPLLVDPGDAELAEALRRHGLVQAWRSVSDHKALGVAPDVVDRWFALADHVVVEADGARGQPFKAPRAFEPPVPSTTTVAIAVIGADALGRVIADRCFRPLRVAAVAGCSPWERLTPRLAAGVLSSERGSRKNVPEAARFVVAVTKVVAGEPLAEQLRDELAANGVESIAIAAPVEGSPNPIV